MWCFRCRSRASRRHDAGANAGHARTPTGEAEIDFRAITEASFDGVAIIQDGRVLYANLGLLEMSGYSYDEMIGRPTLEFVSTESWDKIRRRMESGIDGRFELAGLRKDGRRVLLEATTRTQLILGRVARVAVFRDITERRQLEERLRQVETLHAIGELAGGIAHDFNNLLTVIRVHSESVVHSSTGNDALREHGTAIQEATESGAAFVQQLFALKRRQPSVPQVMSLNSAVQSVSRILRALCGRQIQIVMRLSEDLEAVRADPVQIQQIVMNLAVNARDAMPRGGRLTIETANAATQDGEYGLLRVSDTGHGMSDETKRRIFEPFFTTKETLGGTGLGLMTVRRIVEDSGGFISVDSEPGRGSVFCVYLPRQRSRD
jgi:PAS domain S-box-containing protein